MLVYRKDGVITLESNPGSRELKIGSQRLRCMLETIHQVSHDLILLQTKKNEWIFITIDGEYKEMPAELAQLLKRPCEVRSCLSFYGRCQLILVYKANKKITSAVSVELTKTAQVASLIELPINKTEEDLDSDQILNNFRGKVI